MTLQIRRLARTALVLDKRRCGATTTWGAIVMNANAPPRGKQRYHSGAAQLQVPYLEGDSHISDLEGQRLVSVIQ
jgi:hypothetical protein